MRPNTMVKIKVENPSFRRSAASSGIRKIFRVGLHPWWCLQAYIHDAGLYPWWCRWLAKAWILGFNFYNSVRLHLNLHYYLAGVFKILLERERPGKLQRAIFFLSTILGASLWVISSSSQDVCAYSKYFKGEIAIPTLSTLTWTGYHLSSHQWR